MKQNVNNIKLTTFLLLMVISSSCGIYNLVAAVCLFKNCLFIEIQSLITFLTNMARPVKPWALG